MNSKNLLSQLSKLEDSLNSFSFEELSTKEAKKLKSSYRAFKSQLEERIWGEEVPAEWTDTDNEKDKSTSQVAEKLIATVSHEMRTPLTGIIGFTDLLKEGNLSKNQHFQINAIASASKHLMDILNELLDYSKLSAGLEHFEMVDFNLHDLIQDIIYLCNTLMVGKDIRLVVDVDKKIPKILKGDPSKLSQVLLNILSNSIKFVDHGQIALKASLLQREQGDVHLEFILSDTGIGIQNSNLDKIFDSFQQLNTNEPYKYGGSGLGLTIVKQIVEKLGGEIDVASAVGKGTKFCIKLKYQIGDQQNDKAFISREREEIELRNTRILVFEDNPLNQKMIEQRLQLWGCKVLLAEKAIFGLKLLETSSVDLILLDLRMPEMSGFEVAQKIRNHQKQQIKNIPIIGITADHYFDIHEELTKLQFDDFILKPFSPDELYSKISKQLKSQTDQGKPKIIEPLKEFPVKNSPIEADLEALLESCQGNLDLLIEVIDHYKRNAIEFIGKVRLSLITNDLDGIAFATHKIKSGLQMMASQNLISLVSNMHAISKTTKDTNRIRFLYDRFVLDYPKEELVLEKALRELIANHK